MITARFLTIVNGERTEYDHVRTGAGKSIGQIVRRACRRRRPSKPPVCEDLAETMADIALQNDANATAVDGGDPGRARPPLDRARRHDGGRQSPRSAAGSAPASASRLSTPTPRSRRAAGMTIADIFARHGEADFRSGEARVIARLLEGGPQVLATGGGAVMNPDTRAADQSEGRLDLAQRRFRRADAADQQAQERAAAAADRRSGGDAACAARRARSDLCAGRLTVQSREVPHDAIVAEIVAALVAVSRRGGVTGKAGP